MSESETASLVADYLFRGGQITLCPTVNTKEELSVFQWGPAFSTLGSNWLDDNEWFEWLAAEMDDLEMLGVRKAA